MEAPFFEGAKCQRCRTCERKCPSHAWTLNSDIEDGFPVHAPAKCEGCDRYFCVCPVEAIQFIDRHTELRSQHPKANTLRVGGKCADGLISIDFPQGWALNKRMFTGNERALQIGTAIAVLVLVCLVAWILHKYSREFNDFVCRFQCCG
jgi:ferredoxin